MVLSIKNETDLHFFIFIFLYWLAFFILDTPYNLSHLNPIPSTIHSNGQTKWASRSLNRGYQKLRCLGKSLKLKASETYINKLSARFEREGEPSQLTSVDVFVSTVDPMKEPPLITANTVLSILAMDYPVDKVCCYLSDDVASVLSFESLVETADFARKWVPFCKKFAIEPRTPEFYFAH